MNYKEYIIPIGDKAKDFDEMFIGVIRKQPELIRCKDCKHRPKRIEEDGSDGFNLEFPDVLCPCYCVDSWFSRMPADDWFCRNGERSE